MIFNRRGNLSSHARIFDEKVFALVLKRATGGILFIDCIINSTSIFSIYGIYFKKKIEIDPTENGKNTF